MLHANRRARAGDDVRSTNMEAAGVQGLAREPALLGAFKAKIAGAYAIPSRWFDTARCFLPAAIEACLL